jgi:hypothetical protein
VVDFRLMGLAMLICQIPVLGLPYHTTFNSA